MCIIQKVSKSLCPFATLRDNVWISKFTSQSPSIFFTIKIIFKNPFISGMNFPL